MILLGDDELWAAEAISILQGKGRLNPRRDGKTAHRSVRDFVWIRRTAKKSPTRVSCFEPTTALIGTGRDGPGPLTERFELREHLSGFLERW